MPVQPTQEDQKKPNFINQSSFSSSTQDNIRSSFGFVPTFIQNITEECLPGAWSEVQNLYFNPTSALEPKLKSLIGLAISTQVPCQEIGYFDTQASTNAGATRQEQLEAVMLAALTRHWSTVLNGFQLDKHDFQKEVHKVMSNVRKMMEASKGQMPPVDAFHFQPSSAEETYRDIEKTLGQIPTFMSMFPKTGISGAWSEFKALQINPYTALSGKQKELIGLAVAAQIPCDYCVTFHKAAAELNQATELEINEAISIAAITRHWSSVFHGPQMTFDSFKKDADQMLAFTSRQRLQ